MRSFKTGTNLDGRGSGARRALSINEFCDRYSVGRTTAYEEIAAGRLRAVKAGRRTLIPADSAEAWLAALPDSKGEPEARNESELAIIGEQKWKTEKS